jgi:hypothetical protein
VGPASPVLENRARVLAVETIFSAVLAVSFAGFGAWWIGPLAWLGLAPVFVLFVPLGRGGRLSRLDDRFIGWARKTPIE